MKIAYCIAGTFNSGGMERVLANKANYFAAAGHEVTIITTDQQGRSPYFELDKRIQQVDLGINYQIIQSYGMFAKIAAYKQLQSRHQEKLTKLLNELKVDIVVSLFDHEGTFLWKIKDGSKKVVEIHFSKYKRIQYGRTGIWKWIDRYRSWQEESTVKKYDAFVVLTHEDKGYWGKLANIQVIPNANSFEPTTSSVLTNKQVIAVGRYDYQKNFEDLIQAWSLVHQKCPDWVLHIYGHGELQVKYEKLINHLQLKDNVILCPPTKDIQQAYLEHSVVVMSSRYEGLPMALLEAQVCGLPMVAYTCKCGPRDIIQDSVNGYLVAEGDIEMLANKLINVMQDDQLRKQMGVESKRLSKRFSQDAVMSEWNQLFNELVTN